MLQLLAGLVLSSMFVTAAFAGCDEKVTIPLNVDDKPSCYRLTSEIGITTETVKSSYIDFEITLLFADFENVPEPEAYQFLLIEREQETNSPKISIVNFLCSGEHPIGADALSGSLTNIAENNESEDDVNIFISTGQAAENISVSQVLKAKAKIYDRFLSLYEEKSGEDLPEDMHSNIYVPNMISKKIYSTFFTRTSSSINACSKKFLAVMNDYLIDQVVKTQPYPGIDIRKKRFTTKYRLKWKI